MSYCDFVLAQYNSIKADLPVVLRRQGSQNNLKSGSWFVKVGRDLVSHHPVISSNGADDGNKGGSLITKEFVL